MILIRLQLTAFWMIIFSFQNQLSRILIEMVNISLILKFMNYRDNLGLHNTKQTVSYSPLHSPSNRKRTLLLKQNKFPQKPSHRENKQNIQHRYPKTDRVREQRYSKMSKQEHLSSSKKQQKNQKVSISIAINNRNRNIGEFMDLNLTGVETPKFKCSSSEMDDQCRTQRYNQQENYFSFGDEFRQNINSKLQAYCGVTFNGEKATVPPLKQKNKNLEADTINSLKFSINSLKKKQKMKQSKQKLELRFYQPQKQIKDSKYQREVFCFRK